ncbi:MAG: response regulator, partial [Bacillota bacterium]
MLKVLLVDDEPFVLEGLKIMIDWEKYGFSICGEAANGEDALEIIKTCNPHLVITDIRMPVMDGFKLIESVYEASNVKPKFIILSGYDDFTYVKNAMRYGISDYILKPLDEEELDKVVEKVAKQIVEQRHKDESKIKQLRFIADDAIYRIIKGEAKESVINRVNFILKLKNDEEIGMMLMEIDNFDGWRSDSDKIELSKIRDIIRKIVRETMNNRFELKIFEDELGRFCIVVYKRFRFYNEIEEYVRKLKSNIEDSLNCSVSIAISEGMQGIKSLDKLYKQVDLAMCYKFFKGHGSIIFYKSIRNTALNYDFCGEDVDTLLNEIKKNNAIGIRNRIKNVFHFFSKNMTAPEVIEIYMESLELEVIRYVLGMNGNIDSLSQRIMEFNKRIKKTAIDNLRNDFTEFCMFLARYTDTASKSNTKDIISKMKYYVKDYYNRDISLKTIAKQLYVNPVYLGRLFRKSTGMQFNEYLHTIRIEEAKKLLRRT